MRRQSKMKQMRLGQTIVAERERAESESARMQARKKAHRRQTTSILIVALMLAILGLVFYLGMKEIWAPAELTNLETKNVYQIKAEVVDEDHRNQISTRVQTYIAELEQDLQKLGLKVTKVVLPTGKSRELYVDIEGVEAYFKVNIDRGTAVSVEDMERMVRYLREQDLHPEYVDVRIEGKAYYK